MILREADRVDLVHAPRTRVVAGLGRVARDREDVSDSFGVRAEEHRLEARRWTSLSVSGAGSSRSRRLRSIVADAINPLMRARARGLSFTSTTSTCAGLLQRAGEVEHRLRLAAARAGRSRRRRRTRPCGASAGGASPARAAGAATTSSRSRTTSGALGRRPWSTASRIAAICVGVVPQQPPMMRAPSSWAWAAKSAKYSGVACGKTTRWPARLARPTFGRAARGFPLAAHLLERSQRGLQPDAVVRPDRGDVLLRERGGGPSGADSAQRVRVLVEREQGDDRKRRHGADRARSPSRARRARRTSRAGRGRRRVLRGAPPAR